MCRDENVRVRESGRVGGKPGLSAGSSAGDAADAIQTWLHLPPLACSSSILTGSGSPSMAFSTLNTVVTMSRAEYPDRHMPVIVSIAVFTSCVSADARMVWMVSGCGVSQTRYTDSASTRPKPATERSEREEQRHGKRGTG